MPLVRLILGEISDGSVPTATVETVAWDTCPRAAVWS